MSSTDTSIDSLMKSSDDYADDISDTISENSETDEPMDNTMISVASEKNGETYSQDVVILAEYIREHFETSNIYVFRCVRIDGIYCCCVIYRDKGIVNIESVRVLVKNAEGIAENYSLHFEYYDTIEHAVELVHKIVTTYKLYNGDLYSPEDYDRLIAEEPIIPYSDHEQCRVCHINTNDTTSCGHYICFRCREQSLFSGDKHCPTCNKSDVLSIYHNDVNIINNYHYGDLVSALAIDADTEDDICSQHVCEENTNSNDYGFIDDEDYINAPVEQLIAEEIHKFLVNNPGIINGIVGFVDIFNKFMKNP
uniref:RING-type domain-containing protein n=1 Tax=viral metagenome TaxID=1070528 RepID=A0A6C0HIT8_9ZZZZ